MVRSGDGSARGAIDSVLIGTEMGLFGVVISDLEAFLLGFESLSHVWSGSR